MNSSKNSEDILYEQPVVLFDGVCNLCNGFVQFVIKRDKKGLIRFASLQSDFGQQVLEKFNLPIQEMNTVVLIEKNKAYTHSDAALRLSKHLGKAWPMCYLFIYLPRSFRNLIYNWIARNRYRWFGKRETCMIPDRKIEARFLK